MVKLEKAVINQFKSDHGKANYLLASDTIFASPAFLLLLLWGTLHTEIEAGGKADAWIKTGLKVQRHRMTAK